MHPEWRIAADVARKSQREGKETRKNSYVIFATTTENIWLGPTNTVNLEAMCA